MRVAAEERGGTRAALLRGQDAGLTSGAVGIAGIDQRHAETMLTALQVALSDDQRRGNDFVAGEHGGRGCRPGRPPRKRDQDYRWLSNRRARRQRRSREAPDHHQ